MAKQFNLNQGRNHERYPKQKIGEREYPWGWYPS